LKVANQAIPVYRNSFAFARDVSARTSYIAIDGYYPLPFSNLYIAWACPDFPPLTEAKGNHRVQLLYNILLFLQSFAALRSTPVPFFLTTWLYIRLSQALNPVETQKCAAGDITESIVLAE